MVIFILVVTIAGMAAMIALQQRTNHWIYSLSNFEAISADVNPDGTPTHNVTETVVSYDDEFDKSQPIKPSNKEYHISYSRIFQLFLGSPIVEEIVIRVILYGIINKRIRNPLGSMIWTNSIFAILHFFNAFQSTADAYTFFQVNLTFHLINFCKMVAGFLLGLFYSTRYYLTDNLFENVALHVINNLSAIFIPIQTTFKDIYPDFILPSM
jgi:membrane protease YdiL (CAAX protease family)